MRLASVLLLFFSINASAEIYKCDKNGKVSFSDEPCGDTAQVIKVEPVQKTGAKLTSDSMENLSGELHNDRKIRELDKAIERQQQKIENQAEKYHTTLNSLQEKLRKVKDKYAYKSYAYRSSNQKMYLQQKRKLQDKISETKRRYKTDKQFAYDKLYRLKQERRQYR